MNHEPESMQQTPPPRTGPGGAPEDYARHDLLTGLSNRADLIERLPQGVAAATVPGAEPVALLLIDLNGFHEVNDALGHATGDGVLREVASRLVHSAGPRAMVARLSGDEFAVLTPIRNATHAAELAVHLLGAVQEPFHFGNLQVPVGASIGGALAPDDTGSASELLCLAERARYRAKAHCTGYALAGMAAECELPVSVAMAQELQRAIAEHQLTLHYQPIVDPYTRKVEQVEALVRWQHPERGLLAPSTFIPLAERTGLVIPLTLWVLDQALQQLVAWRQNGLPELTVTVNVAVQHLQDARLPKEVAAALARWDVPASALQLEVTEQGLVTNFDSVAATVRALRELGVCLAIDDFGTGQAAIGYLRHFSANKVKIDRSFIMGMLQDPWDAAFVRSIIDMAGALGKTVVAEGVEDRKTLQLLTTAGCDAIQGYYFSRPVPPEQLGAAIQRIEQGAGLLSAA
jgi:diguanylate cyclase (GGDEF)-like protein